MNEVLSSARYSIVVVPFSYTDQLTGKRRPALFISGPDILLRHNLVWVAMITSAKNNIWYGDISITNYQDCGLPAPSVPGSGPVNFDEMVEVIFGECQVSRHRSEGAGKCEHVAFGLFEWQVFASSSFCYNAIAGKRPILAPTGN